MHNVGKHSTACTHEESFECFMIIKWARENLIFNNINATSSDVAIYKTFTNNLMTSIINQKQKTLSIEPGAIVRATTSSSSSSSTVNSDISLSHPKTKHQQH